MNTGISRSFNVLPETTGAPQARTANFTKITIITNFRSFRKFRKRVQSWTYTMVHPRLICSSQNMYSHSSTFFIRLLCSYWPSPD